MVEIQKLDEADASLFEKMETGIENDYIRRIFPRLTKENNYLYGLFVGRKLAAMGGFTIFKRKYAMLGRLRTDIHFRGRNLATKLNEHLIEKAFEMKEINWIGANTQEENHSANRVLEKLGLAKQITLHGAVTQSLEPLLNTEAIWKEVTNLERKKTLIKQKLIKNQSIFPYECYYPFPASKELFQDDVKKWKFFENKQKTRFFILKRDQKKHYYLHVVYPWDDLQEQDGIWETVNEEYIKLQNNMEEEIYVWIDLTKDEAGRLPANHPFHLPSPWVLYSITRGEYMKK